MTIKDFLSGLKTLGVQVIIKDSEGTMVAKIYAASVEKLEDTLANKEMEYWSIVRSTLITINLKKEEEPIVPISVESVSLNSESITLNIGETAELIATVLPENATNKNVTWLVEDETIVSFSDNVITALSEGTTTISVTTEDGGFTASCEITVQNEE